MAGSGLRPADRKKRLSRLLEMILLIQGRDDWRPRPLADHFGVSETRIYQDIRELVEAGVPVYFSGGGYRIAEEFSLGWTSLSADEVLELLYPNHLFARDDAPREVRTLLEAKLAARLPRALRSSGTYSANGARVDVASSTVKGPVFRRLHEAVAARRRIQIRYASRSSGRTAEREVDPYALIFRRHSWYLIGFCHLRREVRKFRLSRVLSVVFTSLHFAEPADFSLHDYTRGWWEVFGGEAANVAVRFRRRVADLIRDRALRPGETVQEMPGGDVIFRTRVAGIQEISWWVMQYGPDAEVLEPKELRNLIRSSAESVLELYSQPAASAPARSKVAETLEPYYARPR